MITEKLLKAVGASAPTAYLYAPMLEEARKVEGDSYNTISSTKGVAMLVSQLAHESAGFSVMTENLNYQAVALTTLFGSHRISVNDAFLYGRNGSKKADQFAIANLIYGGEWGRKNLGNTEPDDGWTFRGGGPLQLTGRANYTAWGKTIGLSPVEAAAHIRTAKGGISAALWFWRKNGLLIPASKGDVATCTKIINGGTNGLNARVSLYNDALKALNS